jgi:3-phosphoshikimate 1-carboxyvinyltransferase
MTAVIGVRPGSGPVDFEAIVPGSKSITNRALVCAALASGVSRLEGVAPGDDTAAMIDGLGRFGIGCGPIGPDHTRNTSGSPDAARIEVAGCAGVLQPSTVRIDARLAGTTSRFLTAVAALGTTPYVIDGSAPLRRRPMGLLHRALGELGAVVETLGDPESLPVRITGPVRSGRLSMRGDISSQYLTALMLIAPLLDDGLVIDLESELVSRPYLDMTAGVMAAFGVDTAAVGGDRIEVGSGAYVACDYRIEPDASSASYPAAIVAAVGGRATLVGLRRDSLQGDRRFLDLIEMMGCTLQWNNDGVEITRSPETELRSIDVDLRDASDLVPTLAALAVAAHGVSRIRGVGFIRSKESDRLGALTAGLGSFGARITEFDDGLAIEPGPRPAEVAPLETHDDHRLAMAYCVAGFASGLPIEICNPEVVSKSWPGFWDALSEWIGPGIVERAAT